jgi:RimJ/RimL family protein N-acetyltransferase
MLLYSISTASAAGRGLMRAPDHHPLGGHVDIGWRLMRSAWGHGYATAAKVALQDAFARLTEVLAYSSPGNVRSQAVMDRLCLQRDPARDSSAEYDGIDTWRGLVWVARP